MDSLQEDAGIGEEGAAQQGAQQQAAQAQQVAVGDIGGNEAGGNATVVDDDATSARKDYGPCSPSATRGL